jgi:hypothetical protein
MTRDWRSEGVFVGTPSRNETGLNYTASLLSLVMHDARSAGIVVRGGGPMLFPATPMNLPVIRNQIAAAMLDQTEADWLLFIDSDAGFEPDLAERLVEAADPIERPILGALAFMVAKREPDGMGGWVWTPAPTLYDWGGPNGEPGFFHRYEYPDNTLVRVAATGCHTLLIHRGALDKLRAEHGDTWFDRVQLFPEQGTMGEDFSFFARVAKAGIPAYVHTGVKTSHQQTIWLCEDNYQSALLVSRMSAAARDELAAPEGVTVVAASDA